MIEVGDTLAGKYRVLAELGAGGMGRVFRAENTLTGKQVALKCLHAHITSGSDASERLLREARAVSSLTHSNVVDVYDVVRDGDTLFLVMELLKGETLRAYLLRNPHPKISEFIALMLPAMSGVEAAHQSGVIHRDLKPENIFLAQVGGMRGVHRLLATRGSERVEQAVELKKKSRRACRWCFRQSWRLSRPVPNLPSRRPQLSRPCKQPRPSRLQMRRSSSPIYGNPLASLPCRSELQA